MLQNNQAIGGAQKWGGTMDVPQGTSKTEQLLRVDSDGEPRSWAITLSAPNRGISVGPVSAPIGDWPAPVDGSFAIIQWGNGWTSQRVDVDWRQGGVYYVYGTSVTVTAVALNVNVLNGGQATPLILAASAAPSNGMAGTNYATKTVDYGTVALANVVQMPIPRMAYRAWFTALRPGTDAFTLQWLEAGAGGAGNRTLTARVPYLNTAVRLNGDLMQPLIIPPFATGLQVQNTSANNFNFVRVVYDLAL